MRPGERNLITDVAGLRVGNAQDHHIKTGTSVLVGDAPFVAAVDVMGGAPGTRETDLLAPDKMVEAVDALVLSGGSAFGLDAASGVSDELVRAGRGFCVGPVNVPIVPAAILFDLVNGGDKNWEINPYRNLGAEAFAHAGKDFALGTAGAGTGALTAGLKGGLGSASLVLDNGYTVGALVAANPTGGVTMGDSRHFWAHAFEVDGEFGGLGSRPDPVPLPETARTKAEVMSSRTNTTIAIVATDAPLTNAQAKRMAVAAHDGLGRAISPSHTLVDGDLVFAVSTGQGARVEDPATQIAIGHAAAICLARAVARAVYLATPAAGDLFPAWQEKYG